MAATVVLRPPVQPKPNDATASKQNTKLVQDYLCLRDTWVATCLHVGTMTTSGTNHNIITLPFKSFGFFRRCIKRTKQPFEPFSTFHTPLDLSKQKPHKKNIKWIGPSRGWRWFFLIQVELDQTSEFPPPQNHQAIPFSLVVGSTSESSSHHQVQSTIVRVPGKMTGWLGWVHEQNWHEMQVGHHANVCFRESYTRIPYTIWHLPWESVLDA